MRHYTDNDKIVATILLDNWSNFGFINAFLVTHNVILVKHLFVVIYKQFISLCYISVCDCTGVTIFGPQHFPVSCYIFTLDTINIRKMNSWRMSRNTVKYHKEIRRLFYQQIVLLPLNCSHKIILERKIPKFSLKIIHYTTIKDQICSWWS